jgi:hypothetical protein
MSLLEEHLFGQLLTEGLPEPKRQYKFHPKRKWLMDFYWDLGDRKICAEVDGGEWVRGRHSRGKGFISDCEKLNAAQEMGIEVYRFAGTMVKDNRAIETLKRVLR